MKAFTLDALGTPPALRDDPPAPTIAANEVLVRVQVVGATGGVGSFAVQFAAHAGATVIASALPEDEDYLRGLGVGELLDRNGDVAAAVRERYRDGVDAVLDVVSYTPDRIRRIRGCAQARRARRLLQLRRRRRPRAQQRLGLAEPREPGARGPTA
jgi:NADPH:quinone reductase-like Zn-dependent oxidoreductase